MQSLMFLDCFVIQELSKKNLWGARLDPPPPPPLVKDGLIFTQFEPDSFTCSEPCSAHIKRPIFWKLPRLGISNMSFLIADVMQFN